MIRFASNTTVALVVSLGSTGLAAGAEIPQSLQDAVRSAVPKSLAGHVGDATSYEGEGGRFRVELGDMNAASPEEGIVVVEESGKAMRVWFVAAGEKPVRKAIKLPGEPEDASVSFPEFAEGRTLAQVQAGSGTVLLSWNGSDCETVWQSGELGRGESRWYELDDVDDDGTREVVTYQKLLVDAAPDDEMGEEVSGSSMEEAVPTSVLRWDGTRFKKDDELLHSLH